MNAASSGEPITFARHIRPLFRDKDLQSMRFRFDLGSYDDVSAHADHILQRLRSGTMPCDDPWPSGQVDLFARWVDGGKQP